jgi:hypothetical protein
VFQCTEAYRIENGKIGAPLKGAMLIGNGPTDLHRITMIGNDLALDSGIGTCGKNGQGVPVGVGQPTLRMERITVGGTGCMSIDTPTVAARKQGWRGQLVQLVAIVLAVFVAKGALAEPFYVPSGSMEPTLLIGDALLASKYPYGYGTAFAADTDQPARDRTRVRRDAEARRRRGFPLAGQPLAGLGQARRRPARRSHPDAAGPALHQRSCGRR